MRQATGSLSIAQAHVLRALSSGGMLSARQIQRTAGLVRWRTKRTISELTRRDLIFTGGRRDRFEITELGRAALGAEHPDFGRLA